MRRHVPPALLVVMVSGCLLLANCGDSTRKLLSISVTPPTADAKDFPLGGVQFSATGTFTKTLQR